LRLNFVLDIKRSSGTPEEQLREFLGSYSEGAGSSQRELLGSWGSYSGPPWGVSIQGAYNGSLEAPTMLEVPKKLT